VAGVPLHRMAVITRVKVLDTDGYPLLLGVAGQLLEALDAVPGPLIAADFARLGIIGLLPLVAGEGNDARHSGLSALVNHLLHAREQFRMKIGIVETAFEGRAWHAIGGNGAGEPVLFEHTPVLGSDNLDRDAAELLSGLASLFNVPFLAGAVEAPENDRLLDA